MSQIRGGGKDREEVQSKPLIQDPEEKEGGGEGTREAGIFLMPRGTRKGLAGD